MDVMQRRLLPAAAVFCGLALALPAIASADVVEIGKLEPQIKPGCPGQARASRSRRTTGYQAKVGTDRGLMAVPKDGRIVAWTVALGKPGPKQTPSSTCQARRSSRQAADHDPRPQAQAALARGRSGRAVKLSRSSARPSQFPLTKSIPVKKGQVVAITVPTWAPVLASGLGGDTSWRASRAKGTCDDTRSRARSCSPTSSRSTTACTAPRA